MSDNATSILSESYIDVVCLTLWACEYICTLPMEVSLIWRASWTIPKALYLCTRYQDLFIFGVLLYYDSRTMSHDECLTYQKFARWTFNTNMLVAEMIFTIRTWAVLGRTRSISIFLSLFSLAVWVPNFVLVGLWGPPVGVSTLGDGTGCIYIIVGAFKNFNYVLIVVFYTTILPLVGLRAYESLNGNLGMPLMRVAHLDGVFYYTCLFCVSWLSLFAIILFPGVKFAESVPPRAQEILCTILACRLTLNLREHGSRAVREPNSQALGISGFTICMDALAFRQEDLVVEEQFTAHADGDV